MTPPEVNPHAWLLAMWRAGWSAAYIRMRLDLAGWTLGMDGQPVRVLGVVQ